MSEIKKIENKLDSIMEEIKDIVDDIIEVRKHSPKNKELTAKILEKFLSDLYQYLKTASKNSGDNLMAGISLMKIKLMNDLNN